MKKELAKGSVDSQVEAKDDDVQDIDGCRVLLPTRLAGDGYKVDHNGAEQQILEGLHKCLVHICQRYTPENKACIPFGCLVSVFVSKPYEVQSEWY